MYFAKKEFKEGSLSKFALGKTTPMSGATRFGRAAAAAAAAAIASTGTTAAFTASSRSLYSGSFFAATVAAGREETGLYCFQVLKTAKGFRRFVDEAIERAGELVFGISPMPPSEDVIKAMDEISNTVCTFIDFGELCRITHPDRKQRRPL